MQEYKRERDTLKEKLNAFEKKAQYHDDHVRTIDAWFSQVRMEEFQPCKRPFLMDWQLLDEIKISSSISAGRKQYTAFPSGLLAGSHNDFKAHLQSRSAEISTAVKQIFSAEISSEPGPIEPQNEIVELLAREKLHINELEKCRLEVEQLNKYLDDASLRYMLAEKRLDRQKSKPLAKLESQAVMGGKNETGSGLGVGDPSKPDHPMPKLDEDLLAEMKASRREAEAVSAKQKEQLSVMASENEKLTTELTTLNNRLSRLNDDDCSRIELFKYVKAQHEGVIKTINDLEAKNIKLREEAERLQAERSAHRSTIEAEAQAVVAEKESQLLQNENDLSRIRGVRDDLVAEIATRKAAQSTERASTEQLRSLVDMKEERLSSQTPLTNGVSESSPGDEDEPVHDLQTRYLALERQNSMLEREVKSLGEAYQKSFTMASQKILGLSDLEERAARMSAEKAKADQKYFAAMKAKEARDQELRTLRAQSSKSSEIVSQLKDADSANRAMVVNLEKQLAENKTIHSTLLGKYQTCQQHNNERNITIEGLKSQVEELQKHLTTKDSEKSTILASGRKADVDVEALKVRLEEADKSLRTWKGRASGDQNSENEMLRVSFVTISVCSLLISILGYGPLHHMQAKLQKHRTQKLWPHLLRYLRRRASGVEDA